MPECVGDLGEDQLIDTFFAPIAEDLSDDVAALTPPKGEQLLISTDALQEEVHFLRRSPADLVGQKALRVNVSDILASGGQPAWFTLSLSMPPDLEIHWLKQFTTGLKTAMEETGVRLLGGDTTASARHISIAITVLGHSARRINRSGAQVGDWVGVTGNLGCAGIGLDVVLGHRVLDPKATQFWQERHFIPTFHGPFVRGIAARGLVNAMMDLSDGLLIDLPRLCRASQTGARVTLERIPLADEARHLGLQSLDAICAGEDYQLLFAANPNQWAEIQAVAERSGTRISSIGTLIAGHEVSWFSEGQKVTPKRAGWRHFQ